MQLYCRANWLQQFCISFRNGTILQSPPQFPSRCNSLLKTTASSSQTLGRPRQPIPSSSRPFTTSPLLPSKKSHKSPDKHHQKSDHPSSSPSPSGTPVPDNAAQRKRDAELDPYDYADLETGIARAVERLKEALTKVRGAGRISPEIIEGLPVQINVKQGAEGGRKESRRLGDYATVVPKGGRVMQIFVAEEGVSFPPGSLSLSPISRLFFHLSLFCPFSIQTFLAQKQILPAPVSFPRH